MSPHTQSVFSAYVDVIKQHVHKTRDCRYPWQRPRAPDLVHLCDYSHRASLLRKGVSCKRQPLACSLLNAITTDTQ